MTYAIEMRPAALRALKKIDRQDQPRIRGAIALLAGRAGGNAAPAYDRCLQVGVPCPRRRR